MIAHYLFPPVFVLAVCLFAATSATAQLDPESNTDGTNPASRIYAISEAQRLDLIARQLDLNYRMIRSAGYGPTMFDGFEPWPRVPGDIWGYPRPRPIEHPIGHESRQVGPTRWTYRPLYAEDVRPAGPGAAPALGPAASNSVVPQRPRPSDPEPDGLAPPAPRRKKAPVGPREF